jgi:SAM-dependent methyltransferase/uncharacterized protein YbaR (Trm112 family)
LRRTHFEALRPICPLCRGALAVASAIRETDGDLFEGILACGDCAREYPVIDGIPVIVGPIRAWLSANPLQILLRDDLSPEVESLIGDVLGPGSAFDTQRHHTGIYADDHYGGGSAIALLERTLDGAEEGPAIDTGCATGGTTFHVARKTGALTVGVDLNFAMLRVASRALREGRLSYARRRVGLAYDRRDEPVDAASRELVDFWCCDVAALPFPDATFALAASINVLDCTPAPQNTVAELARVLRPGGKAIISTPYDWSPTATPVEHWLGGHSQRGPHHGSAEPLLRELLSRELDIESEEPRVPWRVRLHERSTVEYDVHVITGRRRTPPDKTP